MKKLYLTLGSLFLSLLMSNAQSALVSAGGEASSEGGDVNYAIGQTFANYSSSEAGSVAAGVQQAYEISPVAPADGVEELKIEVSVFPNPTADVLNISVTDKTELNYELAFTSGVVVAKGKFKESKELLMENYVPSTYMLRLFDKNGKTKIFRIIKK